MDRATIATALGLGTVIGVTTLAERFAKRPDDKEMSRTIDFIDRGNGGRFEFQTTGDVESAGNVPSECTIEAKNGVKVAGRIAAEDHLSYHVTGKLTDIIADDSISVYIDGSAVATDSYTTAGETDGR